jgi:hypothetical protein
VTRASCSWTIRIIPNIFDATSIHPRPSSCVETSNDYVVRAWPWSGRATRPNTDARQRAKSVDDWPSPMSTWCRGSRSASTLQRIAERWRSGHPSTPSTSAVTGAPVGVVASGLDVVYPRANGGLWRAVADAGVVISEAPPGTPPDRFRFPLRNRIIAALARVVVVVESRASGGSMITVDEALKRGVPVMAVPGATTTRASEGTNRLLRDGAMVATSPDDVLAVLGLASIGADPMMRELRVVPRDSDAAVLSVFAHDPLDLDRIVAACAPMTLGEVALSLGRLESWGWLRHTSGWFERVTITT